MFLLKLSKTDNYEFTVPHGYYVTIEGRKVAYFGTHGVFIRTWVTFNEIQVSAVEIKDQTSFTNLFGSTIKEPTPITKDEFETAYSEAIAMANEILQLAQMAQ